MDSQDVHILIPKTFKHHITWQKDTSRCDGIKDSNGKITLDYLIEPNIIMKILINRKGE